jgi:entericidin A
MSVENVEVRLKGSLMTSRTLLAALIGATLLLSACATVKGVGRDIQSVGQAGQDAIDGH